MDLKQAYEILGPEGADLDEVERKYDMLLRRATAASGGNRDPNHKRIWIR